MKKNGFQKMRKIKTLYFCKMKFLTAFDLKMIALFTMLIDHIGEVFFSGQFMFKLIGRVAFVLYAFMLVEGIFHTKNYQKYLKRLLLWAIISELPYDKAIYGQWFHWENQNVLWTLLFSSVGILGIEKGKNKIVKTLLILVSFAFPIGLNSDYDGYGVLLVYTFYGCKKLKELPYFWVQLLNIAFYWKWKIQFFAFLGLIPIYYYNGKEGRKTGTFYYSLYALQFLFLIGLRSLIFRYNNR